MAINLERFTIESLHGWRSISIPIVNNRLILVGENGSGKTTIINMLFSFLSRQWMRLQSYKFDSISLVLNGQELKLSWDNLLGARNLSRDLKRLLMKKGIAPTRLEHLSELLMERDLENIFTDSRNLSRLSEESRISEPLLRNLFSELSQMQLFDEDSEPLNRVEQILKKENRDRVLYLPTYRRIEQDLKNVLPWINVDKLLEQVVQPRTHQFLELVEFGMKDVDSQITEAMKDLKNSFTEGLKSLTGSYLSEIISGKYNDVRVESLENLDADAVESILGRIDENLLPEDNKRRLRSMIREVKPGSLLQPEQKILAHFMFKLLELYIAQQKKERNIRKFLDVCNRYLVGKSIIFDSDKYRVTVVLDNASNNSAEVGKELALRQLSSGEKQIVSLFSHLFLSNVKQFFVLIDEPELSLSVPWQKTFLVDILESQRCSGLMAVTHSPFIFENQLDENAHAIDEFWVG